MTDASFFAPGRVNLIGEHLDYNGGRCLPIALGMGTTVSISPAASTTYTSRQLPDGAWVAYAAGVVAALGLELPPLRFEVDSTVPIGAGLSSSAALTCSVALAALWAAGVEAEPERVIRAAMAGEASAGAPTGGLDQTVSVLAREGQALLIDFGSGERTHVPWTHDVLIIDTKVRHALNDGRYAERRAECEEAARLLGVRRLADATTWEPLDGVLARRARHVVTEMQRVDVVLAGDLSALTAGHASLRDDFEVSCPELDVAVEASLAAGAEGARLTGGGFGGSVLAVAPRERADEVRASVDEAFGRRGWAAPDFSVGTASAGARQVAGSAVRS